MDFHNSFQPEHRSVHPAARPLPHGAPSSPNRAQWGKGGSQCNVHLDFI